MYLRVFVVDFCSEGERRRRNVGGEKNGKKEEGVVRLVFIYVSIVKLYISASSFDKNYSYS